MDYIRKLILNDEKSKGDDLLQQIKTDWVLEVLQGEDWGKAIPLRYSYIPLGRRSEKTTEKQYELKFQDQTVSSHQAHLLWHPQKGKYGITHVKVPVINHTYVNNEPIEPEQEIILEDGDQVKMGKLIFTLSYKPETLSGNNDTPEYLGNTPSIAYEQTEEIICTGFILKIIEGNEMGFEFPVARRKIEIKRGNRPEEIAADKLILSDRTVSRNQAKIVWQDDFKRLDVIHSAKATNPTKLIRVIGKRDRVIQLAPDEPEVLRNGDILAMGQTYIYVLEESIEEKIRKIREMEQTTDEEEISEIHIRTAEEEEAESLGPRILEEPPAGIPEEIIEEITEDAIQRHETQEAKFKSEEDYNTNNKAMNDISESSEITNNDGLSDIAGDTASDKPPAKTTDRQIVLEVQTAENRESDRMETGMIDTDQTTSILTRKMD